MDELSGGNFFQADGYPASDNLRVPMVSVKLVNATGRYVGMLNVPDVEKIIKTLQQALIDALPEAHHE